MPNTHNTHGGAKRNQGRPPGTTAVAKQVQALANTMDGVAGKLDGALGRLGNSMDDLMAEEIKLALSSPYSFKNIKAKDEAGNSITKRERRYDVAKAALIQRARAGLLKMGIDVVTSGAPEETTKAADVFRAALDIKVAGVIEHAVTADGRALGAESPHVVEATQVTVIDGGQPRSDDDTG